MSVYEIIATVIAGVALVQPWIIFIYKKFFKRICVSFLPASTIKLFYNKSGSYISLGGVIESKNKSCIINNISVKIIRKSDNSELKTNWSTFSSPIFQIIAGNPVTTGEMARPFKVETNGLCPTFVEFVNSDNATNNRLNEIFEDIKNKSCEIIKSQPDLKTAIKKLKSFKEYDEYEKELLENYYWKEGEYTLCLNISYNNKKSLIYKYSFSLTKEEEKKLKENINKSLEFEIYNYYRQSLPLYWCQKDFIESIKEE